MSTRESSAGLGKWFVGQNPRRGTIVVGTALGTALAALVLATAGPPWWIRLVGALLAWDVGAGIVSNASRSTHAQWASAPRAAQWAFIAVHLTVYPLALLFFVRTQPLAWVLVALLIVKTLFFARVLRAR